LAHSKGFFYEFIEKSYIHLGQIKSYKNNAVNDISNVVFLEGNKCALLIDASGSVQTAKKILDNVNAISNKNICYIVTTHGHPDHYIGSTFFKHRRIKFIVHENFNKYLNTRIKRDLINQGFDVSDASLYNFNDQILVTNSNFLKIDLGDRVITIEALEKSHTNNDLLVFDQKNNLAILGDTFFVGHVPIVESSIKGMINVTNKFIKNNYAICVPGHGPVSFNCKKDLLKQLEYLKLLKKDTLEKINKNSNLIKELDNIGWTQKHKWDIFEMYHRSNISRAWKELEWED
jgi:glyoxylase-like metal-dependent hydrolase (beta-lactamase superfamily II)